MSQARALKTFLFTSGMREENSCYEKGGRGSLCLSLGGGEGPCVPLCDRKLTHMFHSRSIHYTRASRSVDQGRV